MVTQKTSMAALAGPLPRTKRCTPGSTSMCRHSAPVSTDGERTRPWCTGKPRTRFPINHGCCSTLRGSGRQRRKIERSFDPDAVRKLKANAERDIAVAGPELAAQAIHAGLVDEFQMRVCPVVIGGGKRYFPSGVRLDLELVEERRFRNGEIFL